MIIGASCPVVATMEVIEMHSIARERVEVGGAAGRRHDSVVSQPLAPTG